MTNCENSLDDDNTHVQELKRLFHGSNVDERGCLSKEGLKRLCEKLQLGEFAEEVAHRVLCGSSTVDFSTFKDRFVSFLPEIIDVSSGTVDSLISRCMQTLRLLGLGESQRLSRYEVRVLCENTAELEQLSVVDINALFERADMDRTGRITVQQFLAQYRLQKRLSAEVHFIADSYVSTLNLFEALDPANAGVVDSHDLLEYWNKAGLRIDEGISLLKDAGQSMSGAVNAVMLSAFLERELSKIASEASVPAKSAILSLHCCIDHLRCCVREGENRAEHLHKQLQLANQRRSLLIEELEHNQLSIEQGYEKRLRETEERYRSRLVQMEDKFRIDKREIQNEMEQIEEELSKSRQLESSCKNKISLYERQMTRLNEETREQGETISQLEQLNRQLRTELSKAMQPRPAEDNTQLLMWKQKVDLLIAHNKRLREKIHDLSQTQKKKARISNDGDALANRWSSAFRNQILMIRKRRQARGDTLSEMDSEPESIFVRHRRRRLLKRKERRKRYERLASRLRIDSEESCSSTDKSKNVTPRVREEIAAVRQSAAKQLAEAVNEQKKVVQSQLANERRVWEQRLVAERANAERQFAEEKLRVINRMQDENDAELQRILSRPESSTIEQYKKQVKSLESSLALQKNSYERRLSELNNKLDAFRADTSQTYRIDKGTTNFLSLIEKYRNNEAAGSDNSARSLSMEKPISNLSHKFQPYVTSPRDRCEKCEVTDTRLREIYHTLAVDSQVESGFEDIGSSAGSLIDDKMVLKREIRRLKGRLEAVKEKIAELRVLTSLHQNSGQRYGMGGRYKSTLGGSEGSAEWRRFSELKGTNERLESEKLILEARYAESQVLVKTLVEQYKQQLDETTRLNRVLKEVYNHQELSTSATTKEHKTMTVS